MGRFIVLPGFLQSGRTLAEKSSGFRKLMKKHNHELDYIDPPRVIHSADQLQFSLGDTPEETQRRWEQVVLKNNNRCWWEHEEPNEYNGFDESYEYVTNYIDQNGPFDGIVGFSQGSAMSMILLQKYSFKLCIAFSGFCFTVVTDPSYDRVNINYQIDNVETYDQKVVLNPLYEKYYAKDTPTKVFSIYGDSDMLVPGIRSQYVGCVFKDVEKYVYEGGHMIPNKPAFLRPIIERVDEIMNT